MFSEQYLDQLERQLTEFGLDRAQRDLVFDMISGYGHARYSDGYEDGKAAFRSER